ncbi:MAG: hypothetical protein HPY76_09645 [Anaerolineae bacterium]|nr:hypothetical protein [Anaerolineae bacterium]
MNRKILLPTLVLMLLALACGTTVTEPTAAPTEPPTQPPAPTATPQPPTATPTEEVPAPPEAELYFREEFDGDLSQWIDFQIHGNDGGYEIKQGASSMTVEVTGKDTYVYVLYDPYSYDNVRLDMEAKNEGFNNNNISLICRASGDGWYEMSAFSSGLYYFYRYSSDDGYVQLGSGGIKSMKTGKYTNKFSLVCKDDRFTFLVNDVEIHKFTDDELTEGAVGFNVSSYDLLPIQVDVDWFEISEP